MPTGYLAGLDPPTPMPRARPDMAFGGVGLDDMPASPQNGRTAKSGMFDDLSPEDVAASWSWNSGLTRATPTLLLPEFLFGAVAVKQDRQIIAAVYYIALGQVAGGPYAT